MLKPIVPIVAPNVAIRLVVNQNVATSHVVKVNVVIHHAVSQNAVAKTLHLARVEIVVPALTHLAADQTGLVMPDLVQLEMLVVIVARVQIGLVAMRDLVRVEMQAVTVLQAQIVLVAMRVLDQVEKVDVIAWVRQPVVQIAVAMRGLVPVEIVDVMNGTLVAVLRKPDVEI